MSMKFIQLSESKKAIKAFRAEHSTLAFAKATVEDDGASADVLVAFESGKPKAAKKALLAELAESFEGTPEVTTWEVETAPVVATETPAPKASVVVAKKDKAPKAPPFDITAHVKKLVKANGAAYAFQEILEHEKLAAAMGVEVKAAASFCKGEEYGKALADLATLVVAVVFKAMSGAPAKTSKAVATAFVAVADRAFNAESFDLDACVDALNGIESGADAEETDAEEAEEESEEEEEETEEEEEEEEEKPAPKAGKTPAAKVPAAKVPAAAPQGRRSR